jgi:galactonate dehydratase
MKIIDIELFKLPPRWLFLKITTEDGIEGWGEPEVEGRADTVYAAVKEMSEYIIGKDASMIEDIWQLLYRGGFYRGGPVLMSAISGIDQALWDIKGKLLGVPIYDLLGGAVREKMQVYSWVGGDKVVNVAENAKTRLSQGFKAIKMNASANVPWIIESPDKIREIIDNIASVREAVGFQMGIGIDFHGRIHKGTAKVLMRELEPLKPMFIEEPVLPENYDAFRALSQYTTIPIATGERCFSRWDFKTFFEQGSIDIVQPDLSHAGGISEVKRIAGMAESYDMVLAPHCPLGPISLAAALQVDFCCLNAFIQEMSIGIHYNEGADLLDYLKNPEVFDVKDGYVRRPVLPGLGIEIDEDKVRSISDKAGNWRNPIWRNEDGSITEW